MTSSFLDNLPDELKRSIISKLKKPSNISSFLSTNKSNNALISLYPVNHPNFTKAYIESLKVVSNQNASVTKIDPKKLLQKCTDLYESMKVEFSLPKRNTSFFFSRPTKTYTLPTKIYQKVQIFNKAIIIYLKMSIQNKCYLYYLAKIISLKSGLSDLFGRGVRKYIVIEFELYKLYIISYFLKPNRQYSRSQLCDAAYWMLNFSRNGIVGNVAKAAPAQILCASFIHYYFSNSAESLADFIQTYNNTTPSQKFIKSPTDDKNDILSQCIVFMLTNNKAVSCFTKDACALDLSLIDTEQDYKQLHQTTLAAE